MTGMPTSPFSLDRLAGPLLVRRGTVSLFAAGSADEGPEALPRVFLCELAAGALLAPVPASPDGRRVIAVGWEDADCEPVQSAALSAPDCPDDLLVALDRWIAALTGALARLIVVHPKPDYTLAPRQSRRPPRGARLAAARDVVWVELPAGGGLYCDLEAVGAEDGPALFPLAHGAWLTLSGEGRLRGLSTAAALARPDGAAALDVFHAAFANVLPLVLGMAEADELNRLRMRHARETAEQEQSAEALQRLVDTATPAAAKSDDRLVAALQHLGHGLGITVRRPLRARVADADTAPTLSQIAEASGFRARRFLLPDGWPRGDYGAFLTRRREDRVPVALRPAGAGWRIYDPVTGDETKLDPAAAAGLGPEAWSIHPPVPDGALTIRRLLGFGLSRSSRDLLMLAALLLFGAMLGQAMPVTAAVVFSVLLPGGYTVSLIQAGLALALVAVTVFALQVCSGMAAARIGAHAGQDNAAAIWDRVLRLPLRLFARLGVGAMAARIAGLQRAQAVFRDVVVGATGQLALMLSSLALLFMLHGMAAWAGLGFALLQIGLCLLVAWGQQRIARGSAGLAGQAEGLAFQFLNGIAKLRLAAAEGRAFRLWSERFVAMRRQLHRARRIGNAWRALQGGAAALWLVLLMLVVTAETAPRIDEGDFAALLTAYGLLAAGTAQFCGGLLALAAALPLAEAGRPLLEARPEETAGRVDPGLLAGGIEISNLRFRYAADEPPVFDGLNLSIAPGEYVAVVGRSGTGKSTLARLILGLETPQAGAVFLDGHDLRGLNQNAARRQIGTVLQHGRLPPGTILDIVRGTTDAGTDAVWQALREAALAFDVAAMPMGLRTLLTEPRRLLSGGQLQRLMLARAFIQRPAIMILDEPTSALDNATQSVVMRSIDRLPATRILIAHRLAAIRHADRIVVLDGGRVAESGRYNELIARNGLFAAMVAAQGQ